jgi:hypothetical protein
MTREEHRLAALHWLDIAEKAYADIAKHGTLPALGAAGIAQAHATLALYEPPVRVYTHVTGSADHG